VSSVLICCVSKIGDRVATSGRDMGEGWRPTDRRTMNFPGSTLQAKYLHDLSVALDVIEQLPGIDSSRIASMGHSLGGQEAVWLAWYDSRIKAVVSTCGLCMLQEVIEDYIVHNKALYLPNFLREVEDMGVILSDLGDRSIFLASGAQDFMFPIRGVERLVSSL
jgi:dienelactone hydrolase